MGTWPPAVHDGREVVEHELEATKHCFAEACVVSLGGKQCREQQVELELLIGDCLLAVHAIRRVLQQHFVLEDCRRLTKPLLRTWPARPGAGGHVQPRGFADQMIIGG